MMSMDMVAAQGISAALSAQPTVAVLEDDDDLRVELVEGLAERGFSVWGSATPAEFLAELGRRPCHVAIIDVGLPGEDGFAVSTRLRAVSSIGIVMLTGRSAVEDRVRGLQAAADAYLVKPVDLRELAAVLTAVLRRAWGAVEQSAQRPAGRPDEWRLDPAERALVVPGDGHRLRLTQYEASLLGLLLERRGQVVSRTEVIGHIDPDPDPSARVKGEHRVDMLVSRLRRKATAVGVDLPIRAVRGYGYRFAVRSDE